MPTPPHSSRVLARGFTLIELLTVIAIIGILAAIIVPTVGKVRATAKSAKCVSNMRQINTAVMMFEQDNRFFPAARIDPAFCSNPILIQRFAANTFWFDLLRPYVTAGKDATGDIRECPSFREREQMERGVATPQSDGAYNYRAGYALNRRPLHRTNVSTDISLLGMRNVQSPSRTALVVESMDWHCNGYYAANPLTTGSAPANWIGDRHGSKSGYGFADGSVRMLSLQDGLEIIFRPGALPL